MLKFKKEAKITAVHQETFCFVLASSFERVVATRANSKSFLTTTLTFPSYFELTPLTCVLSGAVTSQSVVRNGRLYIKFDPTARKPNSKLAYRLKKLQLLSPCLMLVPFTLVVKSQDLCL